MMKMRNFNTKLIVLMIKNKYLKMFNKNRKLLKINLLNKFKLLMIKIIKSKFKIRVNKINQSL